MSRRFAGLTGDSYGAIIEVTEVIALILISLLPEWGW
ncbi:MAG: adenosylcobinamide-GDP ribazoletransferase [Anaerolineae bacterium]|nr:adenosylcobinamide-GDP ribazoletransferase [Anaerolineae bacterium]